MKQLVLLGSTGSIGTQTLEVIDYLNEEWQVLALSANKNIDLLIKQARKYHPHFLVIMHENLAKELKYRLADLNIDILVGMDGLEYISSLSDADLVINALVGAAGLKPSISTLKAGNRLGLANKESLVIGGEIINRLLKQNNDFILPIDSEHHTIFQILNGHKDDEVKNIIITASGGPFLDLSFNQMKDVSVQQALKHPRWNMGHKISIDSATLMNKGLEVIEAHWLYHQSYDKIKVIIHPESIIHSMVEFMDKSITAELSIADMRLFIQNVLTYPTKKSGLIKNLDLIETGQLTFRKPDLERFPALKLAYDAGRKGGSCPVVLNAANEIAIEGFINQKISFTEIPEIIDRTLQSHEMIKDPDLETIYEIDNWSRRKAEEVLRNCY